MMENVNGLSPELIIHPGETIKELLEDKNMTQEELALRTGYSPKHISEVISGKKDISNKFAYCLEYALGIPTSFWINLQGIYDKEIEELEKLENIKDEEYDILNNLKQIANYCNELKIFENNSNKKIAVLNMRKFLNINDLTKIPNLPINQVAFRGTKNKVNIYILYAWQKICEYLTNKIDITNEFNKDKLQKKYNEIKKTMFLSPDEMIKELRDIFKECGIAFAIVKHFSGAPVQGFIQKKNDRITLCMTIRQSYSDIFWFTLFHEIGHLINDDFKNQYIDYTFIDSELEKNADKFARNVLLDEKKYHYFMQNSVLNYENIKAFAISQNVKPGIVIGRIQNDMKNYSFMSEYKEQYKWE